MANFCAKCGSPVNPETGACPKCDAAPAAETPVLETPAAPAAAPAAAKQSLMDKIKALPQKTLIAIGAAALAVVVLLVSSLFLFGGGGNSYETPVKTLEKYQNKTSYYDWTDASVELLNGFCESELKQIYDVYKSSEEMSDRFDIGDDKEDFEEYIAELKEEYGKNFKYEYNVVYKEELDRDDLKEFREELKDISYEFEETLEYVEALDNIDLEVEAEDMGISVSKYKKLVSLIEKMYEKCRSAEVTEGYLLEVEVTLTGKNLPYPEKNEFSCYVYKVDGRWVSEDILNILDGVM